MSHTGSEAMPHLTVSALHDTVSELTGNGHHLRCPDHGFGDMLVLDALDDACGNLKWTADAIAELERWRCDHCGNHIDIHEIAEGSPTAFPSPLRVDVQLRRPSAFQRVHTITTDVL